jgi:isopenicillin-N N-acyltransferase-like protein
MLSWLGHPARSPLRAGCPSHCISVCSRHKERDILLAATYAARRMKLLLTAALALTPCLLLAEEKPAALRAGSDAAAPSLFQRPADRGAKAHTLTVSNDKASVPVVVVRGTPYEMGRQLGEAIRPQIRVFVPLAMDGIAKKLGITHDAMREVWARSAAFTDDRVEQELAGLADGSGVPLALLQAMHAVPLLMPYSCSSIAAWGAATEDGHLYQTRNLDWSLEVKAHEFPVIAVYLPDKGHAHVLPTFAGMIGAHTGMNIRGIALSEMGDSPAKEMPYQVHAAHFTTFFRTMLYDADSLSETLDIFQAQPHTKRYHYVFGDGLADNRAIKIKAHMPEPAGKQITIWKDNDATDENAPNVLPCVVYNDEGRGAFPTLKAEHGKLNAEKMRQLGNAIPIKGGSVVNVVYDATALKMWVTYAKGDEEAYQRPSVMLDLKSLDADKDGKPDLAAAGAGTVPRAGR